MQILPEGFALPPLPYLLALLAALLAVGVGLTRRRPAATERHVLALAPWIVLGSALHVLYALAALPPTVRPLAGTPAVYLAVAAVAGAVWLAADATGRNAARVLAWTGALALLPPVAAVARHGLAVESLRLLPAGVILGATAVVSALAWAALTRVRPDAAVTGGVGALAVVSHALDGVSTAVGIDLLGFAERTPLSRAIIEFGYALPTADAVGGGWLFVLVKVAVACAAVALFADYVREEPGEAYLLLGFVAAVGLGPGVHNLLLFAVAAP